MTNTALAILMAPAPGGSRGFLVAVQLVLIIGIFYFLLIRPQSKERQRHEQMLKELKKGDEIVTSGGIIGTVVHAEENRLTVRTGDSTRITVDRNRVAQVLSAKGAGKEE